jgi:ribosomal protein L11 methyltransferase
MSAGWQQLRFVLRASEIDVAEALLRLADAQAVDLSDPGDEHALLEPAPGSTPLWPVIALRALFPAAVELRPLIEILRDSVMSASDIAVAPLDDTWQSALAAPPRRILVGRRLALVGPEADVVPGRLPLRLHFGVAFGTGEHPTTGACLEWIERELPPYLRVLDYGCGSGVLGLAALVLGASAVWAVDIEPQALAATRANARLNRCEGRIWIGPPDALPDVEVDCIVANILARTLIDLAGEFAHRLVAGGWLLTSGVLENQVDDLVDALNPYFDDFAMETREGWVCLRARRAAQQPTRS